MMTGTVNALREAVLRLVVLGPGGREREVEAVIDTGYNGSLTLPPYLVAELGLPFRVRSSATLGDGSTSLSMSTMVPCTGMGGHAVLRWTSRIPSLFLAWRCSTVAR